MNNMSFDDLLTKRRSIYAIGKEQTMANDDIAALIENVVSNTPSAFNSQSARVVVLFGDNHDKLWQITMNALRAIVPHDKFSATESKINSFAAGYGTILFFDDNQTVYTLQEKFPLYSDNFPAWAQQSNGMLQFAIWTMLSGENIGASLQHYNELIEIEVKKQWNISQSWQLIAQMPFGNIIANADDKTFIPISERVKVYN